MVKSKKFLGLNLHKQKIIDNYVIDFYCPAYRLVIKIDGSSHNEKEEYDSIRDEYLNSLDLKVIHILDKDIKTNLECVMLWLEEFVSRLPRQSATATPS